MFSRFVVAALTDALSRVETRVEELGWDNPPFLIGMFRSPGTDPLTIEADLFPIQPEVWDLPGGHPAAVFDLISDYFDTQDTRPHLARWLRPDERCFLSFAFVVEGWQTIAYEGYARGDLNEVPTMADAEVRLLTAIDTDLRLYQIVRVRDSDKPTVTVLEVPPPPLWESTVGYALLRLVRLARNQQVGTVNGARH